MNVSSPSLQQKNTGCSLSVVQTVSLAPVATVSNVGMVPGINFHFHTAMQLLWLVSINSNQLHFIMHF